MFRVKQTKQDIEQLLKRSKQTGEGLVTPYQKNLIKGGKGLMAGATLFIGATTLLDTAMTLKERKETKKQVEAQEERLKKRNKDQKRRRSNVHKRHSINRDAPKDLIFDMFESRSGHHRMGNSKFNRR